MTVQGFTAEEWAAAEALADGVESGTDEATSAGGQGDVEADPSQAAAEDGEKVAGAEGDDAGSEAEDEDDKRKRVEPSERAGFRAEKRKWKARQAQEREAIAQERQKAEQEFAGYRKGRELFQGGDPEGAIKEAFGVTAKDFIDSIVMKAKGRDPRVERELAEARKLREEHEKREQQAQLQQAQQQRAQATQRWVGANIVAPLKASGREHLADPVFVQSVFQEMREEYDEDTQELGIDLDEAVERARRKVRPIYERLGKILGTPPPSEAEDANNGAATRPGKAAAKRGSRRARSIPNSRATSAAAATGAPDPSVDPKAWDKYFQEKMLAAKDDEDAA